MGRRLAAGIKALASPRLMVAFFLLMAISALGVSYGVVAATPAALLPLGLLTINLSASIASNTRFRADLPLLVFHVSLLAFVALLAVARLTYFEGAAKVSVGERFAGDFYKEAAGALHGDGARALRFSNDGFVETFPEKNKYRSTRNKVRFTNTGGTLQEGEIGDDRPLVLNGYRIYTSRNRGFVPAVQWAAQDGTIHFAALQLGAAGEDGFTPGRQWLIPFGPNVWMSLSTEPMPPVPGTERINLGAKEAHNKLVLNHDERFQELRLGQSIDLPGGKLSYTGLSAWMGYSIIYDPTTPWLTATLSIAIASLVWFYAQRLWRTWDED